MEIPIFHLGMVVGCVDGSLGLMLFVGGQVRARWNSVGIKFIKIMIL
jgi:hypothetical protein